MSSPDPFAAAPATAQLPQGRLALLFAVTMVSAAGNTAMQSVMPAIGTKLHVPDFWINLAFCWSATLWMVCAPKWARRSDRRGRKAMMAIGLGGFIASFLLCGGVLWLGLDGLVTGFATLVLFAVARSLFGGFASAAPPAVQAYGASRTAPEERTRALALVSSSFGLGTVVGPALAPLMVVPVLGLVGPFLGFASIGVVILIALRLRLPDDAPSYAARGGVVSAPYGAGADPQIDAEAEAVLAPAHARLRWSDLRVRTWIVAGFTAGQAQAALTGIAGFLVLDRLGLRGLPEAGASPIALVLMVGAVATLLAQWGLIPLLRLGPRAACLGGMALATLGTALFAVAGNLHAIALGFGLASLGFGLFRPGFTAGTSLAVTRAEQGEAAGITAAVNGSAYILAPAIGVWLYNHSPWLGFTAIASLCLLVLIAGGRGMPPDRR
ncbi:MAG: MFS transporter [Sphingomonadales bacterium]|nr:MFS transporter [Sphingomonadales bacterium]